MRARTAHLFPAIALGILFGVAAAQAGTANDAHFAISFPKPGVIGAGGARPQGTLAGTGTVTRSIIDVRKPDDPGNRSARPELFGTIITNTVTVPVNPSMNANRIGLAFRDSLNARMASQGYQALFTVDSATVRLYKYVGTFEINDSQTVPGLTFTNVFLSGADAPVAGPVGLGILVLLLATGLYVARRRANAAAARP